MKGKVLIVDDEFDLCLLLKFHLAAKQYDVAMAYTLKEGLQKLDSYHPDILFLDNNLPDGYGWEKVSEILANHPKLKINLISGFRPALHLSLSNRNICIMEKPLSKSGIDNCLTGISG